MYVCGIIDRGAADDALERTVDQFIDQLSERGRVGVLRDDATIADGTARAHATVAGGDVTYGLGADGDWTATGTDLTVSDALEALARDCEYAVVTGVDGLRYPTVAVGSDATADDATLAAAETPAEFDIPAVLDALEATEPYECLSSLVARVKRSADADRAGAIGTFTGRVRAKDAPDDERTEFLEFEKYEGVADERMAALAADLESRDGVYAVELHHRTGVVRDGEDIVFVVVLAGHRGEAFRTVEDGINRLKDEVPLFKKEVTVDDEFWVHER